MGYSGLWRAAMVAMVMVTAPPVWAQRGQSASSQAPSPCLRLSFGPWDPPLNWEAAGHTGNADANGQTVRRLRDSIFLQQPQAAAADGMVWDEKSGGRRLYVFPAWWPAGLVIEFDSASVAGDTLRGLAEAMVADGGAQHSTSRVRALRVACGGSR